MIFFNKDPVIFARGRLFFYEEGGGGCSDTIWEAPFKNRLGMVCVKKTKGRLDCSQPSIFSNFYSIFERADIIARRLDASAKRKP